MTYGHWLQTAHHELADARARLPSDPGVTVDDVGAAVAARQHVYTGLARLVELVVGGQLARVDIGRDTVDIALHHAGDHATLLHLGLTAAAGLDRRAVPSPAPASRVGHHLASAAHAVAVAGDILASHAPPARQPLTPEGVAIRAGAGNTAALADIADLTSKMLLVDAGLPGWVSASHRMSEDLYADAVDRAQRASGSQLAALIDRIMAEAADAPSLLHMLEVAPPPGRRAAITDGATARAALLAARDWMHRNAGEVRAAHLASATRLGLAISAVATPQAPGADWRSWSAAAHAAGKLHGSPPHGDAADIAADLDGLARWVRPGSPRPGQLSGREPRREAVDRLAAVLPSLAEVLRVAAARAARHGHFFVAESQELERTTRSLVYRAATRWRVADDTNDEIYRVRLALFDATASALPSPSTSAHPELPRNAPRLARLAFPEPAGTAPSSRAGVPVDQAISATFPGQSRRGGRRR